MPNKHIRNGLVFIGLCIFIGFGLAFFMLPSPAEDAASTTGAIGAQQAEMGIRRGDAEQGVEVGSALRSAEAEPPNQSLVDTTALRSLSTVFIGDVGSLSCEVAPAPPFILRWVINEGDGELWADGEPMQGTVTREWEPGPNRYVTTAEMWGPDDTDDRRITVQDDGKLRVGNADRSFEGTCRPAQ